MKDEERLKIYTAMVDVTRKWVTVMDAKAAFIAAVNAGLIAFLWTSAKLAEARIGATLVKYIAITATISSLASLLSALWIIMPRGSLQKIFGKKANYAEGFKPISFYGFVAKHYPPGDDKRFLNDVRALDERDFAHEALEQHFTISHVVQQKSNCVIIAGYLLLFSITLTGLALLIKEFY